MLYGKRAVFLMLKRWCIDKQGLEPDRIHRVPRAEATGLETRYLRTFAIGGSLGYSVPARSEVTLVP